MRKFLITLGSCFMGLSSSSLAASDEIGLQPYMEAEQFVQSHLFDSMIGMWGSDRRAWNQLLKVHACGSNDDGSRLSTSYTQGVQAFTALIESAAEQQALFAQQPNQAVLQDISQLAYRLFSSSYAHGYANQVQLLNQIDGDMQAELCGGRVETDRPDYVSYNSDLHWAVSSQAQVSSSVTSSLNAHAQFGMDVFADILSHHRDQFDALVYSHAYQQSAAYDSLFFEVNGFDNVVNYQNRVAHLGKIAPLDIPKDEDGEPVMPHADFAYLLLTSGYHWGTLSVLAMLEEEYPNLHSKVKQKATEHISQVTNIPSVDSEVSG